MAYCAAGLAALGHLPTRQRMVVERCFDDSEGSQLIIHAPFGGRINRALGLALRKRFCVSFDFELQAAADDDTVVLSLGPQHSFPLTKVQSMLSSAKATEVLTQAVLLHPMLGARWRWNLTAALVLPRMNGGKRRPIHLQRMEADDLLAAVWPGLAACQENAPPGPVGVPDHVLARQTVDDCLHEGLSVEGLVDVWSQVESGAIEVHTVESSEPSPFAHAILSGRPYTYLDDAPLEERRTRALSLRRGLGELGPDGLPVRPPRWPRSTPRRSPTVLEQVGPGRATPTSCTTSCCRWWRPARTANGPSGSTRWRRTAGRAGSTAAGWPPSAATRGAALGTDDEAAAACVAGHLAAGRPGDGRGAGGGRRRCRRVRRWARRCRRRGPARRWRAWRARAWRSSCPTGAGAPATCWCACTARPQPPARHGRGGADRRLRALPHALAARDAGQPRSRAAPACSRWSSSCRGSRCRRRSGRPRSCPPACADYDPRWLDELCLSGEVVWARLTPRAERTGRGGTPSPATPLAFVRARRPRAAARGAGRRAGARARGGASGDLLAALRARGACFRPSWRR